MARHTLKILQQMLQDLKSVSDHFGTLCSKGLTMNSFLFFFHSISIAAFENSFAISFTVTVIRRQGFQSVNISLKFVKN